MTELKIYSGCIPILIGILFCVLLPRKVFSTDVVLTSSISCDSLDALIESIYVNDETFSPETTAVADQLLLIAQNKDCNSLPDILNLHGIIQYNLNDPLKAKNFLGKAHAMLSDSLVNTKMSVRNYLFTGLTDQTKNNFVAAQLNFEKALRISEVIQFNRGILQAKLNLSLCYLHDNHIEKAKNVLLEAGDIVKELKNKKLGGYVYQNLAQIYLKQKDYDQAIANTTIAYDIWNELGFEKGLYFCHSGLAYAYQLKKDTASMVQELYKAIDYSGKDKSFVRHQPYLSLATYYKGKGNDDEAQHYYEQALKQSSSIPEKELLDIINNLYVFYERDNDLSKIKRINNEVFKIYSNRSSLFTEEVKKWQNKEIELERNLVENRSLRSLNFKNLKEIRIKNILLAVLFLAFNFALFYFQRYRYKERMRNENSRTELRSKITRDLHDDVGTMLARISMQSQLLELTTDEKSKPIAREIAERSRMAMDSMRDTVWAMDSRSDNVVSLKFKILDYLKSVLEPLDIEYESTFKFDNENALLKADVRQSAYLIFKESITNIAKHSNTKKVDIVLSLTPSYLAMSIQDYGTLDIIKESAGQGLKNMKLRAGNLNGSYSFNYNNGYLTEFSIPLT